MGAAVGLLVGSAVGSEVGSAVGALVGSLVGSAVGSLVGSLVGSAVGSAVGAAVGLLVGSAVGSEVHRHAIERKRAATVDLCTDAGGISAVGHVNGVVWAAAPAARVMRMSEERIVMLLAQGFAQR